VSGFFGPIFEMLSPVKSLELPLQAQPLPSSYRDPAGFMIHDDGAYKRVVLPAGLDDYQLYMSSGLHAQLVQACLTLDHSESPLPAGSGWAKLLVPEQLRFISYPYEWSFDELKDAALLTLELQERALAHGLSLKDASPYNVQFRGSRPVLIDTLSFERDTPGPWVAYQQFCEQFLGPLLLMSYVSSQANRYLRVDFDGFPLEMVSRSLPKRSYLRLGPLLHIHLHARVVRGQAVAAPRRETGRRGAKLQLAQSLRRTVEGLRPRAAASHWTDYYAEARYYTREGQESKLKEVRALASEVRPSFVFDLGTNTGMFARELAAQGTPCVAFDSDAACVNRLYLSERSAPASRILPLVMDLANPSPGLGFESRAALSLFERPQADLVLCLALIHHLRITCNLPLRRIAECLARLGRWLLIEFVPPEDPAARSLMRRRTFEDYNTGAFLGAFDCSYTLRKTRPLAGTSRTLYLFERRG
jgi:hypothetical protein